MGTDVGARVSHMINCECGWVMIFWLLNDSLSSKVKLMLLWMQNSNGKIYSDSDMPCVQLIDMW